jgi:DNA-binding transcriptional MerR regulator
MNKTNFKRFTAAQIDQLNALATMRDEDIDFSDIPEQLDWSGAKRGKFYKTIAKSPLETK